MASQRRFVALAGLLVGSLLVAGTLSAAPNTKYQAPGDWNVKGNMGIGTDAPRSRLEISFGGTGSLVAGTPLGNGPGWTFYAANGNRRDITGWNGGLYLGASPSSGPPPEESTLFISENGSVGIGAVDDRYILTLRQGGGLAIADGWDVHSSRQYKQDIHALTPSEYQAALQDVLATDVVRFHLKGHDADSSAILGLIAEDAPDQLVSSDERDSISLNQYVALLHAALKAQQAQIDQQRQQIAALQERLTQP